MAKYRMVDPPLGWKYGFPKRDTFKPSRPGLSADEVFKEHIQWFLQEGYPQEEIDKGMLNHCRIWEEDDAD